MNFKSLAAAAFVCGGLGYALGRPSLEASASYVFEHLRESPVLYEASYPSLFQLTKEGIHNHPQLANEFVREGILQAPIEPRTYLLMFECMREKAEQKPELMQHFGSNAKSYLLNLETAQKRPSVTMLKQLLNLLGGD